jgi:hypothetical protein
VTTSAAEQPVVSREKHIDSPTFRTSQVQRIKWAKTKLLKFHRPVGILCLRPNNLVGEYEHRIHIVAAFLIRIPANLNLQDAAAYPGCNTLPYHSQNMFDSLGFFTHA